MVRNDSAPSGDGPHAAAPGARRRRLLLGLLALAWLWPLALPIVDRADTVGYIAPALSLVRDGDLLYLDEYDALRMHPRYHRPTPTGLVGNHWNVGLGLALVPSFALGTVLSSGDGMLDEGVLAASQATALLWAALLLWVLLALLRPLPLGWRVGLAAALYAGTPLAFYVHAQGLRPHLLEALGVSVFVWGWLEQRARPTWRAGLLLGLLAAGLALVRTQAALVLLLPAVELGWRLLRRRAGWWRLAGPVAATVVLALGGWLLQRQVTLLLYGAGNTGSLLRALGDVEWHLLDALTHPHHGLLPWSPVVLPALVGLIPLIRRDPALGLGAAALFSVQLVLNGTNFDQALDAYHGTRHWAGGGSFGARKFLNLLPILALGLGALASACGGRRSRILLAVWCGLAALWSLALVGLSRLDPHAVCEAAQSWAARPGGGARPRGSGRRRSRLAGRAPERARRTRWHRDGGGLRSRHRCARPPLAQARPGRARAGRRDRHCVRHRVVRGVRGDRRLPDEGRADRPLRRPRALRRALGGEPSAAAVGHAPGAGEGATRHGRPA